MEYQIIITGPNSNTNIQKLTYDKEELEVCEAQGMTPNSYNYFIKRKNKNKLPFVIIFQLQKTFASKNYLITLDKLHKTLVTNVDEINSQQNISPFIYYWMSCILP